MSHKFILVDSYNLFFRAMHGCENSNFDDLGGLVLHTMFSMIKSACDKFQPDHIVVVTDGNGTWRKSLLPTYKANREDKLNEMTPAEIERRQELLNIFTTDFLPFLRDETNVSFLGYKNVEADDLVARFIELHPNDNVIILSTDNDFVQLIRDNVIIYNSMEERIISKDCIVTADKKKPLKFTLKDGKVTVKKDDCVLSKGDDLIPMKDWVDYALFMKCIRGDKSDNIFSAYPRVMEKSTKTKIGIKDAFEDRHERGYNWQSFMNSTWEDPLGKKHIVKEEYEFNKKIIDLQMIPSELKVEIDKYIMENIRIESQPKVMINIVKYLTKWSLNRLLDNIGIFSNYLNKTYPKE